MKTIHALSGVSGAGKSHYYSTHLASKMQLIDIADEYKRQPHIDPGEALNGLLSRLISHMEFTTDDVAVEAWFKPGSFQRRMIEWAASNNGWQVHYINLKTPIEVCVERVKQQWEKNRDQDPAYWDRYTEARLDLLGKLSTT